MLIVDRIEGGHALCQDDEGNIKDLVLAELPVELKEGDVLKIVDGIYIKDEIEAENRREKMKKRLQGLFERGK